MLNTYTIHEPLAGVVGGIGVVAVAGVVGGSRGSWGTVRALLVCVCVGRSEVGGGGARIIEFERSE